MPLRELANELKPRQTRQLSELLQIRGTVHAIPQTFAHPLQSQRDGSIIARATLTQQQMATHLRERFLPL